MECVYRINCGHEQGVYTDKLGQQWLPDQLLAAGRDWGAIGGHGVHRDEGIPASDDSCPLLYRAERYAMKGYEFKLPDATYEVRLHFAETFESFYRAGFRAFDVRLNGLRLLHQFDPYVAAGGFAKPVVKTFKNIGAPGGTLSIGLGEGAMINAIEIYRVSSDRPQSPQRKRILFVGNSHCLFWELPLTLEHFINSRPHDIHLESHRALVGGKDMIYHYDQTDVVKRIWDGKFDFVVVQSVRMDTPDATAKLEEYAQKYSELTRNTGSQMMLYCTFPYKTEPLTAFDQISQPHFETAKRLGMTFVPAGPAWKEALTRRPDLQLFNISDTVHAGLWGAYLTACVFYGVLTGKTPLGQAPSSILAGQIELDPSTTAFLQGVAWDTVCQYRKQ